MSSFVILEIICSKFYFQFLENLYLYTGAHNFVPIILQLAVLLRNMRDSLTPYSILALFILYNCSFCYTNQHHSNSLDCKIEAGFQILQSGYHFFLGRNAFFMHTGLMSKLGIKKWFMKYRKNHYAVKGHTAHFKKVWQVNKYCLIVAATEKKSSKYR